MSFSFSFTVPTKDAAKSEAKKRMDEVVQQQNVHQLDADHVMKTVDGALGLLKDEAQRERPVCITVSGSLGWEHNPGLAMEDQLVTSSSVAVSAYYTTAKA